MFSVKNKADPDSRLVIGPNRANEIIGVVAIVILGLGLVATINGQRANEANQQALSQFCAQQPTFINISCNVSSGVDAGWLYTVAIIAGIISLYVLYRAVRSLLKPGAFVFDRNSHTYNVDGDTLGRLSDIREVKVSKIRAARSHFYAVEIVNKGGDSDTVNTYMLNDSAMATAERISSFLGVPENQNEISDQRW